jgi:3-oxoacyl-[acyl-carrier protein] reductase
VARLTTARSIQRLTGRVALVTGAAEGVGRAVALQLASEGAAVVLADSQKDRLLIVANELRELNHECLALPTDVADEESVIRLVQQSLSRFHQIDILVNGASLWCPSPVEGVSEEVWDKCIRTNLVSTFLCSKAVVPTMLAQRHGRIISFTAVDALYGSENSAHYAAAKAGIIGFSKALALEVAPFGITANTICLDEHFIEIPAAVLGQSARCKESMGSAVFLASDAASYVTGQMLGISGATESR